MEQNIGYKTIKVSFYIIKLFHIFIHFALLSKTEMSNFETTAIFVNFSLYFFLSFYFMYFEVVFLVNDQGNFIFIVALSFRYHKMTLLILFDAFCLDLILFLFIWTCPVHLCPLFLTFPGPFYPCCFLKAYDTVVFSE